MSKVLTGMVGLIATGLFITACDSRDEPLSQRLDKMTADLSIGSSGDDVATLHDYLHQYGFFPNSQIAADFPAWRPVVATPPADWQVFDQSTDQAVRRLQQSAGLPQTGIVDSETRTILRMVRCGIPEGLPTPDASDKFAIIAGVPFQRSSSGDLKLTWRIVNTDDVSLTDATNAVSAAFAVWAQQTSIQFNQTTSGGNIVVQFGNLGDPSILGSTSNHTVTLNTNDTWSVTNPPPPGQFDIETTAIHEIGHALGLHHSAFFAVRMYPFQEFNIDRQLYTDDKVGISGLYDTYQNTAALGTANDIGIGANGMVWKIGTDAFGNGFRVYKWNGAGWDASDGGAVRVSVDPNGIPWLVDSAGNIWTHTTSDAFSGSWILRPGSGRDIAVGANGDVWMISNAPLGDGFQVMKWNGAGWDGSTGGAVVLSVSPSGIPWVLTNKKNVFRHTNNDPFSGSWELLPGLADDIGVGPVTQGAGPDGYVWSVGTSASSGEHLEVWDEQTGSGSGGSSVPTVKNWVTDVIVGTGAGIGSIAVAPGGVPWVIDGNHNLKVPVR